MGADHRVFSKFHGASAEADWLRVRALFDASQGASEFRVPEPLSLDASSGVIGYQALPAGEPLATHLGTALVGSENENRRVTALVERVGRALAVFQQSAGLAPAKPLALDEFVRGVLEPTRAEALLAALAKSSLVPLHGDFGGTNLWVSRDDDLYVIDPIPAQFCPDPRATHAPGLYDLAHMTAFLWGGYHPRVHLRAKWNRPRGWIEALVGGHASIRGEATPLPDVLSLGLCINRAYWRYMIPRLKGSGGVPAWAWRTYHQVYSGWREGQLRKACTGRK